MTLGGSLPQINLGVQGVTQGGHQFTEWPSSQAHPPIHQIFWGHVKDREFFTPLPVDLAEVKQRMTTTIDGLNSDTLWYSTTLGDYKYTQIYIPQRRLRIFVERCRKDSSKRSDP
ncbi:hypothetical protein TNCV_2089721 [Trichonephila clavipes]|nr:hypothetical protein TNCV_2089721 [Trichonephila clavipes]